VCSSKPELAGGPAAPDLAAIVRDTPAAGEVPAGLDVEAFIRQRLAPDTDDLYGETHRQVDRLLLTLALEHTGGNHRDAARLLGISRQTMRVKLRALGLHVTHSVESDADEPA
jgi:DNA-binding protein Fis